MLLFWRCLKSETGTTRKTKRTMKKLATQANRRYIKKLTVEEFKDNSNENQTN